MDRGVTGEERKDFETRSSGGHRQPDSVAAADRAGGIGGNAGGHRGEDRTEAQQNTGRTA